MIASILMGIAIGYLVITISESFYHRYIQHAPENVRNVHKKLGAFGRAFIKAWHSHHVVHHHRTFIRSHTEQFSSEEERDRLSNILMKWSSYKWHCTNPDQNEFGLTIGKCFSCFARYVIPPLPAILFISYIGGAYFTIGVALIVLTWLAITQFLHPFLHMRYVDALLKAPMYVRPFIKTPYFRKLARHHYLHHKHDRCNYNLLMGGDFLLGVHRKETREDVENMRAIGLWVPDGSANP